MDTVENTSEDSEVKRDDNQDDNQNSTESESTGKAEADKKPIESTNSSPSTPTTKKEKINILLKPVGDAPILKQKLWAVDPDKPISSIQLFIKSYLRLEGDQTLFFFVNQAFAPSPDQLIRNLYECFGSDGKLILNYSTTTAWG